MSIARSTVSAEKLAGKWNAMFPLGTRVRYWTGIREGVGRMSITASEASIMCGTAVVWLDGVSGCVALSHVEPQAPGNQT